MSDHQFWTERAKEGAVLSPIDRISEVLFGLIMVLTFTGTISVANGGRQELRELLWSALGCNLAWGIVDAVMYLMNVVLDRARGIRLFRKLKLIEDGKAEREIVRDELPPLLSSLMQDKEVDDLTTRLKQLPDPPKTVWLTTPDFMAGFQIFLLVFLCTFPVALPFALIHEVKLAMRVSNGIALLLLFAGGFRLAQYAGLKPTLTALVYTIIGLVMVSMTMALGG